jgi:chromosome segregation ATPase
MSVASLVRRAYEGFKVFERFRRKKKITDEQGSLKGTKEEINLRSRSNEDRDPPRYFGRPREEVRPTEVLDRLLQRLKNLDKQRADIVEEIYQLGEEAEKEAEQLGRELSTLKAQTAELEEVLRAIHAHRKGVRSPEPGH